MRYATNSMSSLFDSAPTGCRRPVGCLRNKVADYGCQTYCSAVACRHRTSHIAHRTSHIAHRNAGLLGSAPRVSCAYNYPSWAQFVGGTDGAKLSTFLRALPWQWNQHFLRSAKGPRERKLHPRHVGPTVHHLRDCAWLVPSRGTTPASSYASGFVNWARSHRSDLGPREAPATLLGRTSQLSWLRPKSLRPHPAASSVGIRRPRGRLRL